MAKFKDLTDMRFGRLVVLSRASNINGRTAWLCKCACGSEKVVTGISLTSGRTKSCGCLRSEITSKRRFKDLTGKRFGRLVVVKFSYMNTKGSAMWECICDCGELYLANSYLLLKGKVKSCGCLKSSSTLYDVVEERIGYMGKALDLIGQRFGRLTVIEKIGTKNSKVMWKCKCDCGNYTESSTSSLRKGDSRSCGCLRYANVAKATTSDLLGKRFGKLVVVERAGSHNGNAVWKCRCDCGNYCDVVARNLVSGHTKSCGKCIIHDMVGKKFGKLTVLSYNSSKNYRRLFDCVCDCGKHIVAIGRELVNGSVISCGCAHKDASRRRTQDISGQVFGSLTALELDGYRNNKAWWKCLCKCGKHTVVSAHSLKSGNTKSCGCTYGCTYVSHKGSKYELEIRSYMDSLVDDIKATKERILDGKEIDIFYPSLNLGIEYNGSKFHATLGAAFDNKHKLYHQDKFLLAKEKGIHLINIFDVDWANNQDKIKMYLRSLVVPQKRLFARKCKVKEISRELAVNFTDKYHIQGSVSRFMKINCGLFFNGELYAVMSFGRLRLSKTDVGQYELHRYCVKDGYTILGGAEKLLKHFEKDYKPKYIRSYSDNDYFMGGIYERLGFESAGQCTPRYYWFLNGVELRREACQLKRLKEDYPDLLQEAYDKEAPNKEDYVMLKLGACKVYRSGNTKWEKRY